MNKLCNTSEEILACARALIVAGGYNGFRYADIAAVVGIRKASIHHHFPNNVDLVKAIVVQHRARSEEGLMSLERALPDPFEQLPAYVRYWEQCIEDLSAPICVCALLAGELPVLPDEVALEVRSYFRFLSAWMAALLERGAGQGRMQLTHSAQVEAEVLMATIHGAMLSARAYGDASVFGSIATIQLERLASRA